MGLGEWRCRNVRVAGECESARLGSVVLLTNNHVKSNNEKMVKQREQTKE